MEPKDDDYDDDDDSKRGDDIEAWMAEGEDDEDDDALFGNDSSFRSVKTLTRDESKDSSELSEQLQEQVLTYVTPASFALGSVAPAGFLGFWDDSRQEAYAHCAATGEVAYGVGGDGDVLAVDYRSVLWIAGTDETALTRGVSDTSLTKRRERHIVATTEESAVVVVQSAARRAFAWSFCCESVVMQRYWRRLDAESGFYFYEDTVTGSTQWHRPVVLLGTRRRRSLQPYSGDCADMEEQELEIDEEEEEEESYGEVVEFKQDILTGPYYKRSGRGKVASRAIGALDPRSGSKYFKPSLDRSAKFFVANDEIKTTKWKLGDSIQVLDGELVKRAMADPYMLARGAAARGPLDVVRTMQKHGKSLHTVYFCLTMLQRMELKDDDDAKITTEARACILQTYKALLKHGRVSAITGAAIGVLAQCAETIAGRSEVNKEPWARICAECIGRMETDRLEIVTKHTDRVERRFELIPTRHTNEVATNVCRLFAGMANDGNLRDQYANEAIKIALEAMLFCSENATVQFYGAQCLYSFVLRSEIAAAIAEDNAALSVVEKAADNFRDDPTLVRMTELAIRTLSPGGWRGVKESNGPILLTSNKGPGQGHPRHPH